MINNKKVLNIVLSFLILSFFIAVTYRHFLKQTQKENKQNVIMQNINIEQHNQKKEDIAIKTSINKKVIKDQNVLVNQQPKIEKPPTIEDNTKTDILVETIAKENPAQTLKTTETAKGIKKIFAYDIKDFSNDPKIIEALILLKNNGEEEVIKNLQKYAIRIRFDDFLDISYKRDSYFAMCAYNQYGSRLILINSIYKTAPAEQIACLIAHESMHVLKSPTLEEEAKATKKEAQCWTKLKNNYTTYPDTKLTARLNKISQPNENLENQIAKTIIYKEQFNR